MDKILSVIGNIIKAALFLSIAGAILYGANFVLQLKSTDGCYPAQMFDKQEPDTVDVVFIGSSHIYTDVNPAVLWTEYGIAAYDLAGSNQPLWNSYYYMKEAIEKQSPELIVVDMYRATETRDVIEDARVAMNTLGLARGENRVDNIYASIASEEKAMDYILGFPIYHMRYESLAESDFKPYNGDPNGENYKGFNENCISTTVMEGFNDFSWVEDKIDLTIKNKEYLIKMIELAEETDTELLFVVSPYQGIMPSDKMIYNSVEELAAEYDVPFIDFNDLYEDIGLDPKTDCAEWSHLNYYGSEKYTRFLGEYISCEYLIDDHRGDDAYASWDKNAEHYERIAYYFKLRNTADMGEYLELLLNGEGYTVMISLDGIYDYGEIGVLEMLEDMGLENMEDGSIIVLKEDEVLFQQSDATEQNYLYYTDLGSKTLYLDGVVGENYDTVTGEKSKVVTKTIRLADIGLNVVGNGINILVYDEYTDRFDCVGFDSTKEYEKVRY